MTPRERLHHRALKRFYSLTEAAAVLGVSLSSIKRRITDGTIGSVLVGRRRLVHFGEMDRLAADSRQKLETAPVLRVVK